MTGHAPQDDDVITRAELEWVLERHGSRLDAAGLIEEIEASRDPAQYEPGAVYEDPEGNKWHFGRAAGDDSPHWLRPGLERVFEFVTPRRPLRRLAPESCTDAAAALAAEWHRLGEEQATTEFQAAYRAALRKCADELEYALGGSGPSRGPADPAIFVPLRDTGHAVVPAQVRYVQDALNRAAAATGNLVDGKFVVLPPGARIVA